MPVPTRANASASRSSGIAKVGIEQPSVPRGALARSKSVAACSAAVTARITGWSRRDIAARILAHVATGRQRAREAEEAGVLARAVVVQLARLAPLRRERARTRPVRATASACRIRARRRRARPRRSIRSRPARAAGSPLCDAHAIASSWSSSPSDRRRRSRPAESPAAASPPSAGTPAARRRRARHKRLPSASTTTIAPRCADSRVPPRVASTRTGLVVGSRYERTVVPGVDNRVTMSFAALALVFVAALALELRRLVRLAGVDFSCSPSRTKPITVATGRLVGTRLVVDAVAELTTLAGFDDWLRAPGPWLGGFDFPFGLPRAFVDAHGFGASAAEVIASVRGRCATRMAWRAFIDAWGNTQPAGARFAASAHRRRFAGDVDQPAADALRSGRADVLRRRRAPGRCRRDDARPRARAAIRRGSRSRRIRAGSRMRSSSAARTRTARSTIERCAREAIVAGLEAGATASASRSRATRRCARR